MPSKEAMEGSDNITEMFERCYDHKLPDNIKAEFTLYIDAAFAPRMAKVEALVEVVEHALGYDLGDRLSGKLRDALTAMKEHDDG